MFKQIGKKIFIISRSKICLSKAMISIDVKTLRKKENSMNRLMYMAGKWINCGFSRAIVTKVSVSNERNMDNIVDKTYLCDQRGRLF